MVVSLEIGGRNPPRYNMVYLELPGRQAPTRALAITMWVNLGGWSSFGVRQRCKYSGYFGDSSP